MHNVALLFGSRFLNKRQGRFLDWLVQSGHRACMFAFPRHQLDLSALEVDAGNLDVGRWTLTTKGTRPLFIPSIVTCCNWSMLPLAIILKFMFASKVMYDENDYHEILLRTYGNWLKRNAMTSMVWLVKRLLVPVCDLVTCGGTWNDRGSK
jgi:hypothetical protein